MNPFEPYILNDKITMKNRLVMAPMTTYSGSDDLTPSSEELAYYGARSKTIGMLITAACSVNEQAQAFENQITLKADTYIPAMRELAEIIKSYDTLAVVQLHHGGRMNDASLYDDKSNIVSASAIKADRDYATTPRALTEDEVKQTIDDFVQATVRAIKAGYDGVELHGANTYLLQQFFSPHSNRRDDMYGGTLSKRMRFIEELIDKTKAAIDTHADRPFILGYRFSPEELENPGITLDDTVELVKLLKTKPLDYLHVSLGQYNQGSIRDKKSTKPIITIVQETLNNAIPMVASGQIDTLDSIKKAHELGYDLFATGMSLLADPNWGETIKTGNPIKILSKDTLPTNLYNRLAKNRERFKESGYIIPLENE